ncbi:GNAT family N-acetyltransferase [Paenibacillus spongiae]|uniref:GNAT family N-acetyltransferase n=1 Tax=Paenibacillus spongiae TaxID=2909671 RepID=A0ABY5S1G8_9BACL|nr:GNAT family N-acetyltransferase [Paenibacillus spongiae]UVI27464.1 GNAT family N-acetyltransferase [Paenibacillus spongiae]
MNILYEAPGTEEYMALRKAAGLPAKEESTVLTAMNHSIFTVIAREDHSELIGMGRIIGDGACYYQIVDIAIRPSHQDNGIRDLLMKELMSYLEQNAPADAEVIIMADIPLIGLYQKFGFEFTYPKSISLSKRV